MKWLLLLLLAGMPLLPSMAAGPTTLPLDSQAKLDASQQKRYDQLLGELRCVVCQNETLKASQAPLAADLREEVREQMLAGKTDTQIKDYLVARYGQFVLYRPRFEPETWALWLAPGALLLLALWLALRLLQRRHAAVATPDADAVASILASKRETQR